MTIYSTIQFLKYAWNAKGRHGVHSPFVYDFIEQVLLDRGPIERKYIIEYPSLSLHFENIVSRIAAKYHYSNILYLPLKNEGEVNSDADMVLLNGEEPKQWMNMFNKYCSLLPNERMIIATDIHKTPGHTLAWNGLRNAAEVTMSIDLFGIGLLLFKREFKERQHFVLKS